MRHAKKRYSLNRFTSWRKATLKSMVKNLLLYQSIKTTHTKAKAAQPVAEKLISLGRKNTLQAKRRAFAILCDHKLVKLLFEDISKRFASRTSGFTRIINLGFRRGDNAQLAILELTEIKKKVIKKPKKEKGAEIQKVSLESPEVPSAKATEAEKPQIAKIATAVKEKPPINKKPTKKFFGGLRKIFKKGTDSQ